MRPQREQERLLQAHYADAIPLELFEKEQDRIRAELDLGSRHDERLAATGEAIDRMPGLALDVMADCPCAYRNAPDEVRWLNQAFCERILVYRDGDVTLEFVEPFEPTDPARGERIRRSRRTGWRKKSTTGIDGDGFLQCAWKRVQTPPGPLLQASVLIRT